MSTVVSDATLQERCIETIRFLAVDGVQKANSGHPGMPMGAASVAYTLFTRHLRYDPAAARLRAGQDPAATAAHRADRAAAAGA